MYIDYDRNNKLLLVDDGLWGRNVLIIALISCNVILSYFKLKDADFNYLSINEFSWAAIGLFSILYIFLFFVKYSFLEKIAIDDIVGLEKNEEYSGYTFFILLKNGKKRKLYKMKTLEEFYELENLLQEIDHTFYVAG